MPNFMTAREIGIDAAHRVPLHDSKCKNVHGHRYRIYAAVSGALSEQGADTGMTVDFSFLKEAMMTHIDAPCDHGLILSMADSMLADICKGHVGWRDISERVAVDDYYSVTIENYKLYIIRETPTAENLAAHWFGRLHPIIERQTSGRCALAYVRVWETPNCWAQFPAAQGATHDHAFADRGRTT